MVSLFFSQHNGVFSPSTLLIVIFWVIFWFSSLPMSVTTHSDCWLNTNYFAKAIIFLPYTPPRKPASGLVLCSGDDAVDGSWSARHRRITILDEFWRVSRHQQEEGIEVRCLWKISCHQRSHFHCRGRVQKQASEGGGVYGDNMIAH